MGIITPVHRNVNALTILAGTPMDDLLTFNLFIKERRQELGFTLKKAAKATGVAPSRLHDLERGISSTTGKPTSPSHENIQKISKGYGVAEDYLLKLAGYPALGPASVDEERLVSHIRHLQDGHKAAVLDMVDHLYRMNQPS